MYQLQVANGDMVIKGDGKASTVSGAQRIAQDLSCWLLEPLKTDKLYPAFGSDLGSRIGSIISDETILAVKVEVTRVVNNYIANQQSQINSAKASDATDLINAWNSDDIISTINSITVTTVADAVEVVVQLTTVGGTSITVSQST